jgi:catechol 2,3-dioxygenase-like lactoylglutathione lyase family enzyme
VHARVDVITLGVSDLERALAFYREGLGLHSPGVVATEFAGDEHNAAGAIVILELGGGLLLTLYPRSELAKDANVEPAEPGSGSFSLGQLVASRDEVDATLARAERAGATVTEPPRDRPWGIYSGYFRDPDGHLWEIIWNPRHPPG